MSVARVLVAALGLALVLVVGTAQAHKPSDAYLTVIADGAKLDVRLDVAIRDLDHAITLDADGDGAVTWHEMRAKQSEIDAFVSQRLRVSEGSGVCPLSVTRHEVVRHSDGGYAVVRLHGICPRAPLSLEIAYDGFFDQDPQHRALVRVDAGGSTRTSALSATHRVERLSIDRPDVLRAFFGMVREGIHHVLSGFDHLLFLLALLLPSVLKREGTTFRPATSVSAMLRDVLSVVTAFTVAHSITLALGAFAVVNPPSRLIESAIAASVILAALDNLFGFLRMERWTVPFLLGLVHGFGFSSSLGELGVPRSGLVVALFGFNVGVELGQLACVALFIPVAYLLRATVAYRRVALTGGSIGIALIASVWLVERAFAVQIVSG